MWRWSPALLLCAWSVVACRPDDEEPLPTTIDEPDAARVLSERQCGALFDCACTTQYDVRDDCQEVERLRLEDSKVVAEHNGLSYDGECVAAIVVRIQELACDDRYAEEPAPGCVPCKPYFGGAREGEACDRLGATVPVDTCAQGLECIERVCVPICPDEEPPDLDPSLLPGGEACILNEECRSEACIDMTCESIPALVCGL